MKTLKGQIKRITAAMLAVMMLLSSPMTSLADEINTPAETIENVEVSENIPLEQDEPVGGYSTGDTEDTAEQPTEEPDDFSSEDFLIDENAVEPEQQEAEIPDAEPATPETAEYEETFCQSETVDDVVITVTAGAGVFPEGATIKVSKVTDRKDLEEIDAAVEEQRIENRNVVSSYTFDIKVLDKDGKEIQPDKTNGTVNVSFAIDKEMNGDLEAEVYHVETLEEKAERTEQAIEAIIEKYEESPLADGEVINDLGKKHKKFSEYQKEEAEEQQNTDEPKVNELVAEKLESEVETDKDRLNISVETDGFSFYVLALTSEPQAPVDKYTIFVRNLTDKVTLLYKLDDEEEWIEATSENHNFEFEGDAGFTIKEIPKEYYEDYCRGFLWRSPDIGQQELYTTPEDDGSYEHHFDRSDIGERGIIVLFTPQSSLAGQFNISYVSRDGRYQAGYLNESDEFVCWTDDTWAKNYEIEDTIRFRFKENGMNAVPYRVSVEYNDMQTSAEYYSGDLSEGELNYAPTSDVGFTLTVYWTEEEYNYDLLVTDQVAEGCYSLEYCVEGFGEVTIMNASRFGDSGDGAYAVELVRGEDVVIETAASEGYTLSEAWLNGRNFAEDAERTLENPGVATITIPADEIDPDEYPWIDFVFVQNRVHVDNWDRDRIAVRYKYSEEAEWTELDDDMIWYEPSRENVYVEAEFLNGAEEDYKGILVKWPWGFLVPKDGENDRFIHITCTDVQNDSYELCFFDSNEPLFGEYGASYDSSYGHKVKSTDHAGEHELGRTTYRYNCTYDDEEFIEAEEITITYLQNENTAIPYKAFAVYNFVDGYEEDDLMPDESGVKSFRPRFPGGFMLYVFWSEEEYKAYVYDHIESMYDPETERVVYLHSFGNGFGTLGEELHLVGLKDSDAALVISRDVTELHLGAVPLNSNEFFGCRVNGEEVEMEEVGAAGIDRHYEGIYRIKEYDDVLHCDLDFGESHRAEVYDYDDSRFTVTYSFDNGQTWEELWSGDSCIDLGSDAEELIIKATQREDYHPEDYRDELKGIWEIARNEENTYSEVRAENGVCEYTITDFSCSHELHLADGWRPFNGEYAINYDGSDGYRAGLWVNNELVEIDGIRGFVAKEELTFAFMQNEQFITPYRVELNIPGEEPVNLTSRVSEGKLSYTPESQIGFNIEVYWTEYEYEYEAIARDCDYEQEYIVEIWNSDGGHVDIQDNEEHPYRHGGRYDRTRVLLPKTDGNITFVVEPYENCVFENAWIEGDEITSLTEDNTIDYQVENPEGWLHADFNFKRLEGYYVVLRDMTDKVTLQYRFDGEDEWKVLTAEDDGFSSEGRNVGFTLRETQIIGYENYCRGFLWMNFDDSHRELFTTPETDGTYIHHFDRSYILDGGVIKVFTPQSSLAGQFNMNYESEGDRYQAGYLNGEGQFVCWTDDTPAVNYESEGTINFRFKENGEPCVPYAVRFEYNDFTTTETVFSNGLTGGVLAYEPKNDSGFTVSIDWNEEHYIYSEITAGHVTEGNYPLQYGIDGPGAIEVQDTIRFAGNGHGQYAVELERGEDVMIVATALEGYTLSEAWLNGRNFAEDAERTQENPGVATITIPANEIDPDAYPWIDFVFVQNRVHVDNWDRDRIAVRYKYSEEAEWTELDDDMIWYEPGRENIYVEAEFLNGAEEDYKGILVKWPWGFLVHKDNDDNRFIHIDCTGVQNDSYELCFFDSNEPLMNEYSAEYDAGDGYEVKSIDYSGEHMLGRQSVQYNPGEEDDEEITFHYSQDGEPVNPYKAFAVYTFADGYEEDDLTPGEGDATGEKSFIPRICGGFKLYVFWTEDEWAFERMTDNLEWNEDYREFIVETRGENGELKLLHGEGVEEHHRGNRIRYKLNSDMADAGGNVEFTFKPQAWQNHVFEIGFFEGEEFCSNNLDTDGTISFTKNLNEFGDRLNAEAWFGEPSRAEVYDYDDSRFEVKYSFDNGDTWENLWSGDSCIDFRSDAESLIIKATQREDYQPEDNRDELKGIWEIARNEENTYREVRAENGVCEYTITDFSCSHELHLADGWRPFNGEYAIFYDGSDGYRAGLWVNNELVEIDGIRGFVAQEELTFAFMQEAEFRKPYKVELKLPGMEPQNITEEIVDGKLNYTPASTLCFTLEIYWDEDEWQYEQMTYDLQWDDNYRDFIVETYGDGGELKLLTEAGVEEHRRYNRIRYKLNSSFADNEGNVSLRFKPEGWEKWTFNDGYFEGEEFRPERLSSDGTITFTKNLDDFGFFLHADAFFVPGKYFVDFDINGGYGSLPQTFVIEFGEHRHIECLTIDQIRKEGYQFVCWNTKQDGTGIDIQDGEEIFNLASEIGSTVTLYAQWEANEYTVTYDAQGGTVTPGSKKVTYGETYGDLAVPVKTGCAFGGWYTAAEGGEKIEPTTAVTITADQTLYAHWGGK